MNIMGRKLMWIALATLLLLALSAATPAQAAPDTTRCAAFEELPLGATYTAGASFVSSGIEFDVSGGSFAEVENTGKAAGSGQEMEVNNVEVTIDSAATGVTSVDGITFRFGEYGGTLALRVNGVTVNFDNFADIDGSVIGGAAVSVANGFGNDAGSVTLLGTISDWMLFGQELWIDDVCLHKAPLDPEEPYDPEHPENRPDLGDAPDSTNHVGIGNTAYSAPGVAGLFPTVWQGTPAGVGTGPKHLNPHVEGILGNLYTPERDADPPAPDFDGLNNILAGGVDNANNDRFDDGWRNRNTPFDNCRATTLVVRVRRGPAATLTGMYLNVWFDGNRDGDWGDRGLCDGSDADSGPAISHEWIVRNFPVNMAAIAPGGFVDISINTALALNVAPDQFHWLRFTLSDRQAVNPPGIGTLPDGRGPDFPNAFNFGETEDYLTRPQPPGEPGQLTIDKSVSSPGPLRPGDRMTYTVRLEHVGGAAPARTIMTDHLPAGVVLAGLVQVVEETPRVAPLLAQVGERGVRWAGSLSPGAKVAIHIPVRIARCLGQPITLVNTASALQTHGQGTISDSVETQVQCPAAPNVVVAKRILIPGEDGPQEVLESEIIPGGESVYRFKATNDSDTPIVVHLRDRLPAGMSAAMPAGPQQHLEMTLRLAPHESAQRDVPVKLAHEVLGEPDLVNTAAYIACAVDAPSAVICAWPLDNDPVIRHTNPVTHHVMGRDLGDAPDNTNHLGLPMTAYGVIPARFPTVYQPAALPVGPAHVHPQPFHLGALVSREANADIGPDVDGVNNILPAPDIANRDRFDDGLAPATLNFSDCQRSTLQVRVFIAPAAIAALPQGMGYLNLWVDGARDGDWDDIHECQVPGQAPSTAFEHAVIDFPVNAAALGAGLHTITVTTTQPVYWPAADVAKPAWLRASLSDAPSVKPFSAGAVAFGDGRGPIPPFRLGETEDYLWRGQRPEGPDMAVRKIGRVSEELDPDGARRIYWHVRITNMGDAPATNVVLTDDLALAGDLTHLDWDGDYFPAGSTSFLQDGVKLIFTTPSWAPGETALLTVETSLQPGIALYTNTVRVVADSDIFPPNNRDLARVFHGLRAPIIIEPGSGTTCDNDVQVTGRATPNSAVNLYVDGSLNQTTNADAEGRWSAAITLADGDHTLYAVARLNGATSSQSPVVAITVDSALAWSPLSLRFTDSHGRSHRPVDEEGRTDETGWRLRLRPNETYTVSVTLCCDQPDAAVTLVISETLVVPMSDTDGDSVYTGVFTATGAVHTTGSFELTVVCGGVQTTGAGEVLIDPEGVVFDVISGALLSDATVACMEAAVVDANAGATEFALWPAADYGQVNPQLTGADGYFSFFTPVGTYRLQVERSGYQPYRSVDIPVVADPVRYDTPLTPQISQAAQHPVIISEWGFEPAYLEVQPGAVVEWLNIDAVGHTATSVKDQALAASVTASFNWDSGLLLTGERYKFVPAAEGVYTVVDSADAANTMTIVVKQAAPPDATKAIYLPVIVR